MIHTKMDIIFFSVVFQIQMEILGGHLLEEVCPLKSTRFIIEFSVVDAYVICR